MYLPLKKKKVACILTIRFFFFFEFIKSDIFHLINLIYMDELYSIY